MKFEVTNTRVRLFAENIDDEDREDVGDFYGFQREVKVDAPDVDPDMSDLKHVTVTVYWTYKGDEVSVPLETYISRN